MKENRTVESLRRLQCLWSVVFLLTLAFMGQLGGCATGQPRAWTDPAQIVASIKAEMIIDTEPQGAQIYTVEGEYVGTAPLTRIWHFEKLARNYHVGNQVREIVMYENVNNVDERYWEDLGQLFHAGKCVWIGPGHFTPGGYISTAFQLMDCSIPGRPCTRLGCDPSPVELNFTFTAYKEGYRRQVHTVRCGSLLDYENKRLRSPCRRTVFLEKIPGADIDLDLRLKVREPK